MLGKVYFASGWFNKAQAEEEERVKSKLREIGFEVFSPKEFFVLKPDATQEDRAMVFNKNIEMIKSCDIFFGITDFRDEMGTIWECGCVYGMNNILQNNHKIVYYAETLPKGAQFNIMLAAAANVVITDFDDLVNLPTYLENGKEYTGNVQ